MSAADVMQYHAVGNGDVFKNPNNFHNFILSKIVSNIDPSHGVKTAHEGVQKTALSYEEWAAQPQNQILLDVMPRDFLMQEAEIDEFTNTFANVIKTDKESHMHSRVEMVNAVARTRARGTLTSYLSHKSTSEIVQNVYRHEAIRIDWYTEDLEMGIKHRNETMDLVLSDVKRSHACTMIQAFFNHGVGAKYSYNLYPGESEPKTPLDLFRIQQKYFCIMNKDEGALQTLTLAANAIFNQWQLGYETTHVILSYSDMFYTKNKVDLIQRADRSGNSAASSKEGISIPREFPGFKIVNFPFIETEIQSRTNNTLTRPVAYGHGVNFVNLAFDYVEGYTSKMTDRYYFDSASGTIQCYTKLGNILAQPYYYPLPNEDEENPFYDQDFDLEGEDFKRKDGKSGYSKSNAGHLDLDFLMSIARDNSVKLNTRVEKMGIMYDTNENNVDEYLYCVDRKYAGITDSKVAYVHYPTYFLGQIPEERVTDELMNYCNASMKHVLFSGLTIEEKKSFNDIIKTLIEDEPMFKTNYDSQEKLGYSFISAANKLVNNINNLVHDCPLLTNVIDINKKTGGVDITFGFAPTNRFQTTPTDPSVFSGNVEILLNLYATILEQKKEYSLYTTDELNSKGIFNVTPAADDKRFLEAMSVANECKKDMRNVPVNYWWFKLTKQYPLITPDLNKGRMSTFVTRFLRSFSSEPDLMLGTILNIYSPRTLQTAVIRHFNNIHHQTGVYNMRPLEMQNTYNGLWMHTPPDSKILNFYIGRGDEVLRTDLIGRTRDYKVGFSHGAGILDGKKFHIHYDIRAGTFIGGSDQHYANMRMLTSGSFADINRFKKQLLTKGSTIPIATSYNSNVYGIGAEGDCFDERGNYHLNDFRFSLSGTEWYKPRLEKMPLIGLCAYNYMMQFDKHEPENIIKTNPDLSFNQKTALRQNNHIIRRLNSYGFNPHTKTVDKISSLGLWGDLDENGGKYISSESNVTQKKLSKTEQNFQKRIKFDMDN